MFRLENGLHYSKLLLPQSRQKIENAHCRHQPGGSEKNKGVYSVKINKTGKYLLVVVATIFILVPVSYAHQQSTQALQDDHNHHSDQTTEMNRRGDHAMG